MAEFRADAVRYKCIRCDQVFPNYNLFLNHKRGAKGYQNPCKGSTHIVVLPDNSVPTEAVDVDSGDDETEEADIYPPAAQPADSINGTPAEAHDSVSSNGNSNGKQRYLGSIQPSVTKENFFVPVAFRTAYDAMRQQWGYEGSFNDWVVDMVDRQLYHMGVRVAAVAELPEILEAAPHG